MVDPSARPKLSICIATFKRAAFIEETLDSIVAQLTGEVEVVIVDGASPDDTAAVVARVVARCPVLRYWRQSENGGVDQDYDSAVAHARGEYCWLMTDDDVLVPGAVCSVLEALRSEPDLLVVNAEVRDAALDQVLEGSRFAAAGDLDFGAHQKEDYFRLLAPCLSFIGSVVIRRKLWLARDRASYYGSLFVHIGVIFQRPALLTVKAIAQPLIRIRYGNAMWTSRGFEIWTFKWPRLLWSFDDLSDEVKVAVSAREPWRRFGHLLFQRAIGGYSIAEFDRFLSDKAHGRARIGARLAALCPGPLANLAAIVFLGLFRRQSRVALYDLLRSRHAGTLSWMAARLLGIRLSVPS